MELVTEAKILKWGNSYALRLTKRDVERMGWHEGMLVRVESLPEGEKLELSWPTFKGGSPTDSVEHDRLLYGWDSDA